MQQVSPNVYVKTGLEGCNVGFVTTSEGIVMVDTPQLPTDAVKWRDEIKKSGEVRYIINTEHHIDHIFGNHFFPGIVVSHQGTKDSFAASIGREENFRERMKRMNPEGLHLLDGYVPKPPTITFTQRLRLYMGSHTIELINLPGHTPNETVVYIPEEKVLFTGDNIMGSSLPPFFHQGYPNPWLGSLFVMRTLDIEVIIPGHGDVCDKNAIAETEAFIHEIVGKVKEAISQGLSRDQTVQRITSHERYAPTKMGDFAVPLQSQGIARVYDELRMSQ